MASENARHPNSQFTIAITVGEATKPKIVEPLLPKGLLLSKVALKASTPKAKVKETRREKGKVTKVKASGPEVSLVVHLV
jgi:fructose-1-phosphate kinase PfkB-like protein